MYVSKCIILFVFLISSNLFATSYKTTDLKIPDTTVITLECINEIGQAIGVCRFNNEGRVGIDRLYIYLWDSNNGFAFQSLNRNALSPIFINNNSEISSVAINDLGDKYQVNDFKLVKNGKVIESTLKWLPGFIGQMQNSARATSLKVNNCGQILGAIELSPQRICLVIYNEIDHSITNISETSKYLLSPSSINDNGAVIGEVVNQKNMGFLWTPSLGLQYLEFIPKAINNNGVIAGTVAYETAVIWRKGRLVDVSKEIGLDSNLSTAVIKLTVINDINDSNQMIAEGRTQSDNIAFLKIFPLVE